MLLQGELEQSQRLRKAQQEFEIDDDMIGGQQGNSLLELIKQGKLEKSAPAKRDEKAAAAASSRPASAATSIATEVCGARNTCFGKVANNLLNLTPLNTYSITITIAYGALPLPSITDPLTPPPY